VYCWCSRSEIDLSEGSENRVEASKLQHKYALKPFKIIGRPSNANFVIANATSHAATAMSALILSLTDICPPPPSHCLQLALNVCRHWST
jgi:hypothetical protein